MSKCKSCQNYADCSSGAGDGLTWPCGAYVPRAQAPGEIHTYPQMNETIKDLLRRSEEPMQLYILTRIEELEQENAGLLEAWREACEAESSPLTRHRGGRQMTNFELITQNSQTLDDFLSAVQDDALEAEGCALYLHFPPNEDEDSDMPSLDWKEWLEQEVEDEMVYLPHNRTIRRWKKRDENGGNKK